MEKEWGRDKGGVCKFLFGIKGCISTLHTYYIIAASLPSFTIFVIHSLALFKKINATNFSSEHFHCNIVKITVTQRKVPPSEHIKNREKR